MSRKAPQPDSAPKPARSRLASSRLRDTSNGEAPSAAHQALMDETQARLNTGKSPGVIAKIIQSIEDLAAVLPTSIAEGTETDKIYHVITNIQGPDGDAWSTFNRRFDILFKEDAQYRDADGRLHMIRRGELGMTIVARYLRDIKWNALSEALPSHPDNI
ncbi:hypothetical protein B0H14DRAFT_3489686 [Mycena olivaceomarginata]|nr:hypothetical protein B0H14DRAFT_3489686 [Mycena olivaceomarginata]